MRRTDLGHWALGIGLLWAPAWAAPTALQDPTRPLLWAAPHGNHQGGNPSVNPGDNPSKNQGTPSPMPQGLGTAAYPAQNQTPPQIAPGPPAALVPSGHVAVLMLHPEQPFALVDGLVVRPGERVGDWRVTGITERGLALRRDGQTRILSPTPALVKTMRPPAPEAHKPAPPLRRSP